ncbi:beta-galactosidase [Paenibacillus ferrarius]|uniref:beta-galactosidase n=1 Tax=Paenibacillus ferrarius TaxID=1469647 RepID=UPI003D2AA299
MKPQSTFPYGAVFKVQRDHSREHIRNQLQAMKQSGMNTAVIWPAVYWWEDSSLPHYPYNTGHYILQVAEEIGLQIIMELSGQITSLEYAPDYAMKEEFYAVKYDGTYTNDYLYFGYLNYNHPELRAMIVEQFAETARQYKGYASLYGYDIWNETMFESYDVHTLRRYRKWLEDKYGTIDALNDVWDRVYRSFDDIHFNRWMWASVMPVVDYHRFHKEVVGMFLQEWYQAVKAVDPEHPIIADNIHSMVTEDASFNRPQDDWNVAQQVDEFGISFYPKTTPNPMPANKRWLVLTGSHSASKTGRFWISELQTHIKHMYNPESAVSALELKIWVWEAIAHGAKGLIYWKWDPFNKGLQTGGRGLVDYQGRPTPRLEAAVQIANVLKTHEPAFAAYEPEAPKAVILYDKDTHNFSKAYMAGYKPHAPESIYLDSIAGLHQLLWSLNIPVKVVTPEDIKQGKLSPDQVLFMTNQLTMSRDLADAIRAFAASGGTVVADGKIGEVDDDGTLHLQQPGGTLHDAIGCEFMEIDAEQLVFELNDCPKDGQRVHGYFERKILAVTSGEVKVRGAFGDGAPAFLERTIDRGRIYVIATHLWYGYHKERHPETLAFMERFVAELGLQRLSEEKGDARIKLLKGDSGALLFVFQYGHTSEPVDVHLAIDEGTYRLDNVLSGDVSYAATQKDRLRLNVTTQAYDVTILKISLITEAVKEED